MNLDLSINLAALNGVSVRASVTGERLLCIDLGAANGIRQTEKGIYLSCSLWENKNGVGQYGDTHYIKARWTKEERAALPQGTEPPYIGHGRPIQPKQPAAQPVAGGYWPQQSPSQFQQQYLQQPAYQPQQQYGGGYPAGGGYAPQTQSNAPYGAFPAAPAQVPVGGAGVQQRAGQGPATANAAPAAQPAAPQQGTLTFPPRTATPGPAPAPAPMPAPQPAPVPQPAQPGIVPPATDEDDDLPF